MKVLFLDIDGVLNSHRSAKELGNFPHGLDEKQLKLFDHRAVDLIRTVCQSTNCSIVLSSTWRILHNFRDVGTALNLPIIDATPRSHLGIRGEEINMWLMEHPEVTNFAIVDDDSDMLPEQMSRFVKTSFEVGLTTENAQKLEKILKENKNACI